MQFHSCDFNILSRRINLKLRSVLHKASLKKGSYNSRIALELFQTGTDITFQFLLRPWGSFGSRVPFDIAVDTISAIKSR